MRDFDAPSYDSDDETTNGFPPGVAEFRRRLQSCDAFVISSPEYNTSTPGGLKNLIDWTSRFHPQPFNERSGLLLSASPSLAGGNEHCEFHEFCRGVQTLPVRQKSMGEVSRRAS
jgi:chromate reductase, NAD(P)H dehydrogenase (quinone)